MIRFSSLEKLLALLAGIIVFMIVSRIIYSGVFTFSFLVWNLFLAWIPLRLSLMMEKQLNSLPATFIFGTWLLFFPNALYIVTDLIHLEERGNVPLWYDALLLYFSASTGLLLAFISLYKIELFFQSRIRNAYSDKLVIALLFLGSFGVYLGRFLRWNSWNIITDPFELLSVVAGCFVFRIIIRVHGPLR